MKRYFIIEEINEEDMVELCHDHNEKPIDLYFDGACSEQFQLPNGNYMIGIDDENHSTIEVEIE